HRAGALQYVKASTREPRAGFQIEDAEAPGEVDMVERLEVKLTRLAPGAQDLVLGVVFAKRDRAVGEVGYPRKGVLAFLLEFTQCLFRLGQLFAETALLGDLGVGRAASSGGCALATGSPQGLDLSCQLAPPGVDSNRRIEGLDRVVPAPGEHSASLI